MVCDKVMMKKSQQAKRKRRNQKKGKELWAGKREAMSTEMEA